MTDAPETIEPTPIEGDGDRLLPEDILVPPTENPDATVEPVFFELSRIMIGVMVATDPEGNRLFTLTQTRPNGPFPPSGEAQAVNDVVYNAVLDGNTGPDGRVGFVATRLADGGVDLILQDPGESVSGPRGPGTPGPDWAPPVDLGLPDGVTFRQLQVGVGAAGLASVFGLDGAGEVWWLFQNPPVVVERRIEVTPPGTSRPITVTVSELEPADPPYSGWQKLPGVALSRIARGNGPDGRNILFGITDAEGESALVRNEPETPNATDPTDWTGWREVAPDPVTPFTALSVSIDRDNALNVFVVDGAGEISHSKQDPPGSRSWTPYTRPGLTRAGLLRVAAGLDGDGDIALAAIDGKNFVWSNLETSSRFARWTGWQPIATSEPSCEIDLEFNADGRLTLVGLTPITEDGGGGMLWSIDQAALDSTEWSARFTSHGFDGSAFTLVRDLRPPSA